jgi:hypothetical protein
VGTAQGERRTEIQLLEPPTVMRLVARRGQPGASGHIGVGAAKADQAPRRHGEGPGAEGVADGHPAFALAPELPCSTYSPGFAVPPGTAIICDNPNGFAAHCEVTGILSKK